MIPNEVIQDWAKNKKRIQDRLNRIKKRIKKYQKQEKHFEMRLKAVQKYEKESRQKEAGQEANQENKAPDPK
jgi:chaperonin cofactor prefoldin